MIDHRQHRPPPQRPAAQPPRTVHALKQRPPARPRGRPRRLVQKYTVRARLEPSGAHKAGPRSGRARPRRTPSDRPSRESSLTTGWVAALENAHQLPSSRPAFLVPFLPQVIVEARPAAAGRYLEFFAGRIAITAYIRTHPGPKHVVTKGSTPVLSPAEARKLLGLHRHRLSGRAPGPGASLGDASTASRG